MFTEVSNALQKLSKISVKKDNHFKAAYVENVFVATSKLTH